MRQLKERSTAREAPGSSAGSGPEADDGQSRGAARGPRLPCGRLSPHGPCPDTRRWRGHL